MAAQVVADNTTRIKAELRARAALIVAKAAFDIEGIAKTLAPVDTGNLRNSIAATPVPGDPLRWRIVASAAYAIYVELGTRRAAAQAFLVPALMRVVPTLQEAFRRLNSGV